MAKLDTTYSDFFRIDLDARGGYARVADVTARGKDGSIIHRAFKVMRHELDDPELGLRRFQNEIRTLADITKDLSAPVAITRLVDCGFVQAGLSLELHGLEEGEKTSPSFEFHSAGVEIQDFLNLKVELLKDRSDHWLPYIVVELAPFDDSLLRQIKPVSEEQRLNLYRLPVNDIILMALKMLDVIAYLHEKMRVAYIDWKPEHIYWNGPAQQLKLIDWNVHYSFSDTGKFNEKQLIHEDLRVFCGAALYCSLALNDPEDAERPIGPPPVVPKNTAQPINPRYWTDKPNFYEREGFLDDRVKFLVQMGLDPTRSFGSIAQFRNALLKLVGTVSARIPRDMVQHFKRARSFIAANDLTLAIGELELAVRSARAMGIVYSDAEKLLKEVQGQLAADQLKKNAKFALSLGEWKYVFDLYNEAAALDPENETIKRELQGLQGLQSSEAGLRRSGLLRYFMNPFRLKGILHDTREVINKDNPTFEYVKKQYENIRAVQFGGLLVVIIVAGFSTWSLFRSIPATPAPDVPTLTQTMTLPPVFTSTATVTPAESTATGTSSPSETPSVPTETPVVPTVVQGYGILNVAFFYPVESPNGKRIEPALTLEQPLTILASQTDRGELWYQCTWEVNGVTVGGWILGRFITFVPAPTVTP